MMRPGIVNRDFDSTHTFLLGVTQAVVLFQGKCNHAVGVGRALMSN